MNLLFHGAPLHFLKEVGDANEGNDYHDYTYEEDYEEAKVSKRDDAKNVQV